MGSPTSSCSEIGLRPQAVADFVNAAAAQRVEIHSLTIRRRGQTGVAAAWAPWTRDRATHVYSVSKTLTGTAIGLLIADGQLAVGDRLVDVLADQIRGEVAPGIDRLTVHHLLSMSTGHTDDQLPVFEGVEPGDWLQTFCTKTPQEEPGSTFCYNNPASWVLGEIVRIRTGESLSGFLMRRVLGPMGFERLPWLTDPLGRELGFSGAFLTPDQVADLGELYLNDGVWRGTRLLPEGWVDLATRPHTDTSAQDNPHSRNGYCYHLWRFHEGFRFDGHGGQYALVLPKQDAVIALTSGNAPTQPVLDLAWEHLVPGFDDPAPGCGDDDLAELLHGLEIPAQAGEPLVEERITEGTAQVLPPDPEEEDWRYPAIAEVCVRQVTHDAWALDFHQTGRDPQRLPCGNASWAPGRLGEGEKAISVATRAVQKKNGVRIDLAFVETPHRLVIALPYASGPAFLHWNTPPLHGPRLDRLGLGKGVIDPVI